MHVANLAVGLSIDRILGKTLTFCSFEEDAWAYLRKLT